jgi:FSR family fosmidomycin resistance protein-like MFS transporter
MILKNNKIVPLLIFLWFSHLFIDVMFGIWPVFKTLAHLDLSKAGLIVAAGALVGEGSQLFFGSFGDRGYRKHFIILGLLCAAGTAFLSYFESYTAFFFLYLLTCVGSGSFHPCAGGIMSSLLPEKRSLLVALFASGGSLGMAGSQLVYLYAHQAVQGSTWFLAVPLFLMIGVLFFYRFPKDEQKEQQPKHSKNFLKDFANFLKQPRFRFLYLLQVANQSILCGTIFILPDVLLALGHPDWVCYGGGHFCFIVGGFFMVVPAGYLADRISVRPVLIGAGLVGCAGFYALIFFGSYSVAFLLVSLFVMGGALNLVNPLGVALGTHFEPSRPSSVSAFLMGMVWCVSEAVGPGGVGILSGFFEDYAPVKALALLGGLFLIQIFSSLALPKEEMALCTVD